MPATYVLQKLAHGTVPSLIGIIYRDIDPVQPASVFLYRYSNFVALNET